MIEENSQVIQALDRVGRVESDACLTNSRPFFDEIQTISQIPLPESDTGESVQNLRRIGIFAAEDLFVGRQRLLQKFLCSNVFSQLKAGSNQPIL